MWRYHVIYKARHSTPSTTEFEKQVHKVELFLFFTWIISDCFLLNDPAALVHCWRHVSINVFINVFICFSPVQFLTYSIQPPKLTSGILARFWSLLVQAILRGLNVRPVWGLDWERSVWSVRTPSPSLVVFWSFQRILPKYLFGLLGGFMPEWNPIGTPLNRTQWH